MRSRSLAACTFLTLSTFTLGGCLISSGSSDTVSGTYIGRETLAQMKPGETKEDFVVATLGQPSCKSALSDGSQLWKYNYSRTKRSGASVFVLLSAGSKEQTVATTFVELKDGVVTKAWQDASAPSEATTVKTTTSSEPK